MPYIFHNFHNSLCEADALLVVTYPIVNEVKLAALYVAELYLFLSHPGAACFHTKMDKSKVYQLVVN